MDLFSFVSFLDNGLIVCFKKKLFKKKKSLDLTVWLFQGDSWNKAPLPFLASNVCGVDSFFFWLVLRAGKNSTGASETKHWQDMITKPRQAVLQWHRLKPE